MYKSNPHVWNEGPRLVFMHQNTNGMRDKSNPHVWNEGPRLVFMHQNTNVQI